MGLLCEFAYLDISRKWNQTTHSLVLLASFTQQDSFVVHLCGDPPKTQNYLLEGRPLAVQGSPTR